MDAPLEALAKARRSFVPRQLGLGRQGLAQYLAMFGFGRATVPRSPAFQAGDEIVVQISPVKAGHDRAANCYQ